MPRLARAMTVLGLAMMMLVPASAQRPSPDTIAGANGDITLIPITHGTVELVHGSQIVLVDPSRSMQDPGAATRKLYAGLKPPTLILITDIHEDHFDPDVIRMVKAPATVVVGPRVVSGKFAGAGSLANGQRKTVDGVLLEAVPMYNLTTEKGEAEPFHTKGRGNGYVVTLGGKRFYFAGDTSCTPEIKALKNIDVAFLPMNLPYTMSSADAVQCALAFKPKLVYPYHYIGYETTTGPAAFEKGLAGSGIEVRRRDWYVGMRLPQ